MLITMCSTVDINKKEKTKRKSKHNLKTEKTKTLKTKCETKDEKATIRIYKIKFPIERGERERVGETETNRQTR